MERIAFLLPAMVSSPVGGFKIVYEYGNRLASDGYQVTMLYPATRFIGKMGFSQWIKSVEPHIRHKLKKKPKWFEFHPEVKHVSVFSLRENNVPKADKYIATSMETSIFLNEYKNIRPDQKFYFIQGFESWNFGEEKLLETWKYKMNKIVIAPWLLDVAKSLNEEAALVENGFDFSVFRKDIDYKEKNKYQAIMLYHTSKLKGCEDGIKAMKLVKDRFPQFKLLLFGTPDRPADLPSWITYYQKPDKGTHNRIYNESAIFVGPSYSEGFCLTPPEAMQCGCAVACTNIGGYTVVAHHNETALLSEVGDINSLAENVIELIADDELRYRIADNGYKNIQQYTWDRAFSKFKMALK